MGFHHAGLTTDERDILEANFKSGITNFLVFNSFFSQYLLFKSDHYVKVADFSLKRIGSVPSVASKISSSHSFHKCVRHRVFAFPRKLLCLLNLLEM